MSAPNALDDRRVSGPRRCIWTSRHLLHRQLISTSSWGSESSGNPSGLKASTGGGDVGRIGHIGRALPSPMAALAPSASINGWRPVLSRWSWANYRSGSVVGQNVISDPDRQRLAIDRVGHRGANRHATLGRSSLVRSMVPRATSLRKLDRIGRSIRRAGLGGQHHITGTGEGAGRVVKKRTGNTISAPSERPIQLACIVRTRSGQP